jgi:hypothetical protein
MRVRFVSSQGSSLAVVAGSVEAAIQLPQTTFVLFARNDVARLSQQFPPKRFIEQAGHFPRHEAKLNWTTSMKI